MLTPPHHEPEIQGHITLQSVNPSVKQRIENSVNGADRFVLALQSILENTTPHIIPRVDVVSRRKGRAEQPWADRSLDIEFIAPGGHGLFNLHFSDAISAVITHHQVANIVADLTDLLSFIDPSVWQLLDNFDRYKVILSAIPPSLIERHGLHKPGSLTLSAKAAPTTRLRRTGTPDIFGPPGYVKIPADGPGGIGHPRARNPYPNGEI